MRRVHRSLLSFSAPCQLVVGGQSGEALAIVHEPRMIVSAHTEMYLILHNGANFHLNSDRCRPPTGVLETSKRDLEVLDGHSWVIHFPGDWGIAAPMLHHHDGAQELQMEGRCSQTAVQPCGVCPSPLHMHGRLSMSLSCCRSPQLHSRPSHQHLSHDSAVSMSASGTGYDHPAADQPLCPHRSAAILWIEIPSLQEHEAGCLCRRHARDHKVSEVERVWPVMLCMHNIHHPCMSECTMLMLYDTRAIS